MGIVSRQFRFYMLKSDIERLIAELRVQHGAKVIEAVSVNLPPIEIDSLFRNSEYDNSTSVYCYLMAPTGARISSVFMVRRQLWAVDDGSEVIEFSGCDFNGSVLMIGRFYFQTDFLSGESIWPKRPEFLDWAGKLFRTTKRSLRWSKTMRAYIGGDALSWKQNGGRFASFRGPGDKFIYEDEV